MKSDLDKKLRQIRMVLLDVDGVLTEGEIILGSDRQEFKIFNVQDGMGITLARMGKLKIGIITGRESESVRLRARELHVDACYQGIADKQTAYKDLLKRYRLHDEEVCYMGDDLLDLALLQQVGVAAAPANAREEIQAISHIVTRSSGGRGAVRELIEVILKAQNKWADLVKQFHHQS